MKLSLLLRDSDEKLDKKSAVKVIESALRNNGVEDKVEISLFIVGEEEMRELNLKYRSEDKSTDVLSFPLENEVDPDGYRRLGDVVICWPVVERQASERQVEVQSRASFLISHGVLHLLGVHHH